MSYGFTMHFVEKCIDTAGEALELGSRIVSAMTEAEQAKKIIESNIVFIDRKLSSVCSGSRNKGTEFAALQFIIPQLFTLRLLYWGKHRLLGVASSDKLPEIDGVAYNTVYFQNSTDQDYELSTWSDKIPVFELAKERASRIPNDGYHHREAVYTEVMQELRLIPWLYGRDVPDAFKLYSICGIHCHEQILDFVELTWDALAKAEQAEEI